MVNDLAGFDLQIASGDDAVHPRDFEVRPPERGKPQLSMSMIAEAGNLNLPDGVEVPIEPDQHVAMEMITYDEVGAGAAIRAARSLEASGFVRQEDDYPFATYTRGGRVFVVMDEPPTLVLIRLTPVPPPPQDAP